MIKIPTVFLFAFFCGGLSVAGTTEKTGNEQNSPVGTETEKKTESIRKLTEQLRTGLISADVGWEVFSKSMEGEKRDKLLIYLNILAEMQRMNPKNLGYRISVEGVFIRDCSAVLSVPRETLLKKYSTKKGNDKNEEGTIINAQKLFWGLHNGEIESLKDKKENSVSP